MNDFTLFTIGFTRKSACEFFTSLKAAEVRRVVDVRLHNRSQLAGFTKLPDFPYFLEVIAGIDYLALPELAPTEALLNDFKLAGGSWTGYARGYVRLLRERQVERSLLGVLRDGDCLLCSEAGAEKCHRRLAAEYLRKQWGGIKLCHLGQD